MNVLGLYLCRDPRWIPIPDEFGKAPGGMGKCVYNKFDYLPENGQYVYFLVVNDEVVYIGQSNVGVKDRIKLHARHLKFDKVFYIYVGTNVTREVINSAERKWINRMNPLLNGVLTTFEGRHSGKAETVDEIWDWALNNSVYYRAK